MAFPLIRSAEQLRRWLSQTTDGQQLLGEITERQCNDCGKVRDFALKCAECEKRPAVLVVLHSDGFVEAFGPHSVDVRVANLLHTETPRGGQLAEQYLDSILPERFREHYYPGGPGCRATGRVRRVTAEETAVRIQETTLLLAYQGNRQGEELKEARGMVEKLLAGGRR